MGCDVAEKINEKREQYIYLAGRLTEELLDRRESNLRALLSNNLNTIIQALQDASEPPADILNGGVSLSRYRETLATRNKFIDQLWAMIQGMRSALINVPHCTCTAGWWSHYSHAVGDLGEGDASCAPLDRGSHD